MNYNWQQPQWPNFIYNIFDLQELLYLIAEKTDCIKGLLKNQPNIMQPEFYADLIASEAMEVFKTNGNIFNRNDDNYIVCEQLGIYRHLEMVKKDRIKAVAALTIRVHQTVRHPLTDKMLFEWHTLVLQHQAGMKKVGQWRISDKSAQIISAPDGIRKVHFEAPPASRVRQEMVKFINWYNSMATTQQSELLNPAVFSSIIHLYFLSIHPFSDGNGRIARALSEKALVQGFNCPLGLSLSKIIERDKKPYYENLEFAQRSNEITAWLRYYLRVIHDALCDTESLHVV